MGRATGGKGTRTASWLGDRCSSIDLRRGLDDRTAETVINRAEWLGDPDRRMVIAVFGDGLSAAAVAALQQQNARQVRRVVARAAARLLEPIAVFVATRSGEWPNSRAEVGRAIYHHGRSLRETAGVLGLSLYTVRKHRDAIEGIFESERARARRPGPRGTDRDIDRGWR